MSAAPELSPPGLGSVWRRGDALFRTAPGIWMLLFTGYALLSLVLLLGGLVIPMFGAAGLFLSNQAEAGLYLAFLRRLRGFPAEPRTALEAFGSRYWALTLAKLIQTSVQTVFGLPLLIGLAPAGFVGWTTYRGEVLPGPELILPLLLAGTGLSLVGVFGLFYFLVAWLFAAPLILDRGLEAWPALQHSRRLLNRHPWRVSWILLVVSTYGLAGLLIAGIGVIGTGAHAWAMLAVLYEDLAGPPEPPPIQRGEATE
ncbi:MAG: hypothetical protein J0L84_11095 [Verrucomicrobia bacterium]|nr:hypothetical protein [Verrucomicrobiota bacterium]